MIDQVDAPLRADNPELEKALGALREAFRETAIAIVAQAKSRGALAAVQAAATLDHVETELHVAVDDAFTSAREELDALTQGKGGSA